MIVFLLTGYLFVSSQNKKEDTELPAHVLPYVDGTAAIEQVNNFYRQYIVSDTAQQREIINGYGSDNLQFYATYYQHGFDPITCSEVMPVTVSSTLVSTGQVATVKTEMRYPDATTSEVLTTVVLNGEMQIDSISCPGPRGHLLPNTEFN